MSNPNCFKLGIIISTIFLPLVVLRLAIIAWIVLTFSLLPLTSIVVVFVDSSTGVALSLMTTSSFCLCLTLVSVPKVLKLLPFSILVVTLQRSLLRINSLKSL